MANQSNQSGHAPTLPPSLPLTHLPPHPLIAHVYSRCVCLFVHSARERESERDTERERERKGKERKGKERKACLIELEGLAWLLLAWLLAQSANSQTHISKLSKLSNEPRVWNKERGWRVAGGGWWVVGGGKEGRKKERTTGRKEGRKEGRKQQRTN